MSDELFPDAPRPGETADVDLGGGLRARVPLILYSKDGHTIGDDPEATRRAQARPAVTPVGYDMASGIADVIVVWNVLEHFWPYWDVVSVDWPPSSMRRSRMHSTTEPWTTMRRHSGA